MRVHAPEFLLTASSAAVLVVSLMYVPDIDAAATQPSERPTHPMSSRSCMIHAGSSLLGDVTGVVVDGECRPINSGNGGSGGAAAVTRTVQCRADGSSTSNSPCGPSTPRCMLLVNGGSATPDIVAFAVQRQDPATKRWVTLSFWCPQAQTPVPPSVAAADVRDQVIRLLPRVAIATTDGENTLVNIQTVLWADTTSHRNLGRVTIVGQAVWLHIDFEHATWFFGDGSTSTATSPGKRYDDSTDPCASVACPDYFGHTFTIAGSRTISLSVSWNAGYSLDGTHYLPVDPVAITGPTSTLTVHVRQARGVLVPDPSQH